MLTPNSTKVQLLTPNSTKVQLLTPAYQAEERAWTLFNKLRSMSQVNVMQYNVVLNTCNSAL